MEGRAAESAGLAAARGDDAPGTSTCPSLSDSPPVLPITGSPGRGSPREIGGTPGGPGSAKAPPSPPAEVLDPRPSDRACGSNVTYSLSGSEGSTGGSLISLFSNG